MAGSKYTSVPCEAFGAAHCSGLLILGSARPSPRDPMHNPATKQSKPVQSESCR
jgi:hypothetical protein